MTLRDAHRSQVNRGLAFTEPLHDITITNSIWCMAYTEEVVGGGAYIAQWPCSNIAIG